jgi:hypothetical protein
MYRHSGRSLLACALLAAAPGTDLAAQDQHGPSSKQAVAVRTTGPIQVDGRLDEATWHQAAPISDFAQKEPDQGAPPTDRTEVTFAYDDHALYIGAHMYSRDPSRIPRSVTRRDQYGNSEHIVVAIDPFLDRRTAYAFSVTSGGVRRDYYLNRDSEDLDARDFTFDPVWEARVQLDSTGWTAEMRIPFSQLRFTNKVIQTWGLNINRWVPQRNEDDYWVVVPRDETGFASRFGTLTGLESILPSRRMELLPYVAGNANFTTAPAPGDPFDDGSTGSFRAGGDFKMGLGPSLTLDATFNPDFGQVEADPAQLNLTAFETIFVEKRPFFTDGNPALLGPVPNYYYSRRIGAVPRGQASGDFVQAPDNTTILGATRVTGRLGSNLTIGAQAALTQREFAETFDSTTRRFDRVEVEPLASYGVLRLQQQFGAASSTVGFSLSGMRRYFSDGTDLPEVFSRRAAAGGADWRLRFQGGRYELSGWTGFSMVQGDSSAILRIQRSSGHYLQRPDFSAMPLDPSRTSLWGFTGRLRADKNAGNWLWGAEFVTESPGFEANDMGRLQNADDFEFNGDVNYRETNPGPVFRRWNVGVTWRQNWNYDWVRTVGQLGTFGRFTLNNFSDVNVNLLVRPRYQDDVLTRGGPLAGRGATYGGSLQFNTSYATPNSVSATTSFEGGEFDYRLFTLSAGVTLRPASAWDLSLTPSWRRFRDPRQFVSQQPDGYPATYGARYVFATVDQSVLSAQIRFNYTFTPDLTLEFYAEPFTASGSYSGHGELSAARSFDLRVYGTDGTSIAQEDDQTLRVTDARNGGSFTLPVQDFNNFSFRSNLVIRWEWTRGSTLYLVWQQNRAAQCAAYANPADCPAGSPPGTISRPGFLGDALTVPGDNYLAVKVSYWIPVR